MLQATFIVVSNAPGTFIAVSNDPGTFITVTNAPGTFVAVTNAPGTFIVASNALFSNTHTKHSQFHHKMLVLSRNLLDEWI